MGRPATCECGTCTKCKHRAYMHGWYRRNLAKARENARLSRLRRLEEVRAYDRERGYRCYDTAKKQARRVAAYAVAKGRLVREPCDVCGAAAEAHHDDYSKPLAVRWLCRTHHGEVHRTVVA